MLASVNFAALTLSVTAAVAIFRFDVGMLAVLAASSVIGLALHLAGVI